MTDDVCVMQIGFMRAHFTGYQPSVDGNKEFCEDIPNVVKSVFVIDYLHNYLRKLEVDFRIIKDVQNLGVYAKWEDLTRINDLEKDTVFYQPPQMKPEGVLTISYDFSEAGNYIGIITATDPENQNKTFSAVFPFTVGGKGMGYWPLIIFLAVFIQTFYWLSNGGLKKLRVHRKNSHPSRQNQEAPV